MKIFVDFDRTLLDTGALMTHLYKPYLVSEGFLQEEIDRTLSTFASGVDLTKEMFSIERHLEALNVDVTKQAELLPILKSFFEQSEEYLFPGAVEFLRSLSSHHVILLTFGNYDFQNMKVLASGIGAYCSEICITEKNKAEEITARVDDGEVCMFIDDHGEYFASAKEKLGNELHTAHFLHPENKRECLGCVADLHTGDFQRVTNYIQDLCAA